MFKFLRSSLIPLLLTCFMLFMITYIPGKLSGHPFMPQYFATDTLQFHSHPLPSISSTSEYVTKAELDLIMKAWGKDYREMATKQNELQAEALNNNITWWLSVIAAICTLLPIAATVYQSWHNNKLEEELKNRISQSESMFESKISVSVQEMNGSINNNKNELNGIQTQTDKTRTFNYLSLLNTSIASLVEVQDFNMRNRIAITDSECVRPMIMMLDNVSNMVTVESSNAINNMNPAELRQLLSISLMASNSFEYLLNSLECIFEGEPLIKIISYKSTARTISRDIGRLYDTQNLTASDTIHVLTSFTSLITNVTTLITRQFFEQ